MRTGSDVADTDLSATLPASPSLMSTIHPDEPSVLRECNASLIDKLASSQDQIATLKKQVLSTGCACVRLLNVTIVPGSCRRRSTLWHEAAAKSITIYGGCNPAR